MGSNSEQVCCKAVKSGIPCNGYHVIVSNMETTADNISETQSQRDAELVWDHYGDVESDPLLGTVSGRRPQSPRDDRASTTLQLSLEEAQTLLAVLDNARYILSSHVGISQDPDEGRSQQTSQWTGRGWWSQHCFPSRRRFLARHIFLITLLLQAICILAVSLMDITPRKDDKTAVLVTGIIMIVLQLVNLFFIFLVSVRLVRQKTKYKMSVLLLSQAYLATLLLFAGIYTLTYRLDGRSWRFIVEDVNQDPIAIVLLYSKFLYFSVSTATLCGSDNVLPKEWYNCLFTAIQMLLSFVYFASILGQTLSNDTQHWLGVGHESLAVSRTTSPWPDRRTHSVTSRGNSEAAGIARERAGDRVRLEEEKREENGVQPVLVNIDTETDNGRSINTFPPDTRNTADAPLIIV